MLVRAGHRWIRPVAAVFGSNAAAAERAFVAIVVSVAGGAARHVAWSRHWRFAAPWSGVPCPAAAAVSAVLCPVAHRPCPAVAGISDPALHSRYLERPGVPWREGR